MTISWLRDRRSILPLLRFFCLITAGPVALALVVAFTAAGDWLYGGLFGASPAAVREAKLATFVFCLSAPFLIARAFTFGRAHDQPPAPCSSRGAPSPGSPPSAAPWCSSPVSCRGRRRGRPPSSPAWRWRRSSRAFSRHATSGPSRPWPAPPPASASCGDSPGPSCSTRRRRWARCSSSASSSAGSFDPDLALAAFGVVHGLTGLMMSPMRNLLPHRADPRADGGGSGGPPALRGAGGRGVRPHRGRALRHPGEPRRARKGSWGSRRSSRRRARRPCASPS